MTLLELNGEELRQKIEAELASNPALEQVDEHRCPTCGRLMVSKGPCQLCNQTNRLSSDQPIVFVSPYSDFTYYEPGSNGHEDYSTDDINPVIEDLPTFLLRQLAPDLTLEERPLAAHILTSLDEDGLLRLPLI